MSVIQSWLMQDNAASTVAVAAVGTNGTYIRNSNLTHSTSGPGSVLTASFLGNGTSDCLNLPTVSFADTVPFSFGIYAKSPNAIGIFAGVTGSIGNRFLKVTSTSLALLNSGATGVTFTVSAIDTNWHHYLITRDSSDNCRLYIDGIQAGSTQTFSGTWAPAIIGKQNVVYSDCNLAGAKFWDTDEHTNAVAIYGEKDATAPTITSGTTFSLELNHTAVGTISATGSSPITYSIDVANDNALFTINSSTGVLAFNTAQAAAAYHITVRAANSAGAATAGLTITVNAPTVSCTDLTADRVYQRTKGTTAKTISLAGTYTGDDPASISIQLINANSNANIGSPIALGSATISGGNWGGSASIPQGGWYNFKAISLSSVPATIATSSQTSNKWGVGILIATLGQSNMSNMYDVSSSPPTMNATTREYNGTWGNIVGNGAIRLADAIQTVLGLPVGLLRYAVSGSGVEYNDSFGIWDSLTAGQPYPVFASGLTAAGGDCEFILWHQGEADTKGATSRTDYKAGLDNIYSRIRTATGRSTSQLKFGCAITGSFSVSPSTDDSVNDIRHAQLEWIAATSGVFFAGSSVDMIRPGGDLAHWTAPYYERMGRRYAQAVLNQLSLVSYGADGLVVASASRLNTSVDVYLNITQNGGSALKELDGSTDGGSLTGFQISDDDFATTLTISTTAFSSEKVKLTLSTIPTNPVKVRYQYGQSPNITNPTFDNTSPSSDSLGLPIQPFENLTVDVTTISDPIPPTHSPIIEQDDPAAFIYNLQREQLI